MRHRGLDGHQDAEGGDGQGGLRRFRGRRRVGRLLPHHGKVGEADADIVGDDVLAVHALHHAAHGPEQLGRFLAGRVPEDHRLAAAIGQVADRRLVGHAAREAQHVGQGFALVRVGPHAAAAEGGPEHGIVNCDDCG